MASVQTRSFPVLPVAPSVFGPTREPTAPMLETVTPTLEPLSAVLPHPAAMVVALPLQSLAVPLPAVASTLPAMPVPLHAMRTNLHAPMVSPCLVVGVPGPQRGGRSEWGRRVGLHRPRGRGGEDDACKSQQHSNARHTTLPRQSRPAVVVRSGSEVTDR